MWKQTETLGITNKFTSELLGKSSLVTFQEMSPGDSWSTCTCCLKWP